MTPLYQINLGGQNITSNFNDRLLSMCVVEHTDREAGTLDIELDDRGSALELPPKGASLEVFLGFVETGIASLGTFVIDNIVLDWSPTQKMTLKGHSADIKKTSLKESRTENYAHQTLGEVATKVAQRAGLGVQIIGNIGSKALGAMVHQNDESDMNLLRRLTRDNNAIFNVGGGQLVIAQAGVPLSASGISMDVTLTPGDVTMCKVELPDRSEFGTTTAYSFDFAKGKRVPADGGGGGTGSFNLKHLLPDAVTAANAAQARMSELNRAKANAHAEMAYGNANISAGGNLTLSGFRPGMDGTYTIQTVEHNYDSAGYVTKIDAENQEDGGPDGASGDSDSPD